MKSHKIQASFDYFVPYLPYRCRKYRHEHRNEDITLFIRSVTSDEAPIAFRLSDYSHTEAHRTEIRLFKGKLYERMRRNDIISRGGNRDIRLKQLRQRAANYLLINGIVWQQTGEPRYCINTFGLGHNHGGTGLFVEDFYNPNIPNRNDFSALDGEKAVAYANEVAQRRGTLPHHD